MKANSVKFALLGMLALATVASVLSAAALQQQSKDVQRGEYLVKGGGCGDCHTPMKMGPSGPEPDQARLLSGHPEALVLPPAPKLPAGPWMGTFAATMTAWAGPWGVSFTSNLTPDPETGLGKWKAQTFIDTMRSGRVMGKGRQIQPPMPYQALRNLTDDDLSAIFAYLQSIPRLSNRVPDPIAPQDAGSR
jgi:mono/diheme cytochrome c family protein